MLLVTPMPGVLVHGAFVLLLVVVRVLKLVLCLVLILPLVTTLLLVSVPAVLNLLPLVVVTINLVLVTSGWSLNGPTATTFAVVLKLVN
jgi:hypothetical protein